jgi:acetylcholinesterase
MQSGAPLLVGDVTNDQKYYDNLVLRASCVHADECLYQAPFDVLKAAIATSPGIFDYQVSNLTCQLILIVQSMMLS